LVIVDSTRPNETEVYGIDELKKDPLPVGVDPRRLETYLSDKDFEVMDCAFKASVIISSHCAITRLSLR